MQIGMLGPLEIRTADSGLLEVPGARLRALLIALALEPGRAVQKTTLVDWIWGDNPPADAANALQALVSRLRRVLPDGSLGVEAGGYRLTVKPADVDAVRFERLLDQARGGDDGHRAETLRAALDLWRGAPMQDVDLRGNEAFDAAVTRLEALRAAAQDDLYEAEIRLGRGPDLIAELTELVARDPLRERLAAALMRALAEAGRGTEALAVYQQTRETLADELGVDPSPDLSALHVALLRGEVGARQADRSTNLRAELTSYVGKYADIAAVRDLIANHRLTTLTGPGGSGKTRLAVETAHTLLEDLPDGAWLVELTALGPADDIAQATLAALGLRDALHGGAGADPMDRLVAALRERETLLVLDNCEHLIESAATFAHRLLGECRKLRILATSREPLGITGEALWQVEPLNLPAPDADSAAIATAPAVELLRDRASAVRKDLGSDAAALATMARICRALDGIPLAIELAAARLRTMSLEQLAHRLDDRFRLLTGGSRTAIPQHRTLRAVVDWSWELLSEPERTVLRRLAVFAGGASLEAAEQVCATGAVEGWEVLELLTALTEKSLLIVTGDDAPRYRMLGTIAQYARERLDEAGEADSARRAHLAYFTELAATADPRLRRGEQLEWLAVLDAEHDNIAAAMRGALAAPDAAGAARLAAAAGWYWWLGGHKSEGMEMVTAAADAVEQAAEATDADGPDDETLATVYGLVVHFATTGPNDQFAVEEWITKSHGYGRRTAGPHRHPALVFVGALERMLHGPEHYLPAFEALIADEDPWVRALSRLQLGKLRVMLGQDGPEVDAHLEGSLAEFRAIGERWGISFALTELAERLAMQGEFAKATEYLDEAAGVVAELDAIEDVARTRSRQAQLFWLLGDPAASAGAVAEAQRWAERTAWPGALAQLALERAELARWSGDAAESHRQIDIARTLSKGSETEYLETGIHDLLGYLAPDTEQSRAHRRAELDSVSDRAAAPLLARVLVGLADLAAREGRDAHAVRLLAASAVVRGMPDRSQPDVERIERETRSRLGEASFTEATRVGAESNWRELAEATFAD
ncbi:helix-turn-helix domain-containing protein [Nocardia yunnanensis]|uniref:Helix-turn-helix domain-containing protein n=1 Tax=Nocardia yunnanensis TaxID=2382165 RepID=A0A386Z5H1_9NOCA|nr:BTAD domain-containing putative transcriptional regulator [Nocardia yunnanensis]AYF72968.1 helix-turn-helix domain-containing protein [Nocardia yunnanensis]